MLRRIVQTAVAVLATATVAGAATEFPRVTSYDLDVRFVPSEASLQGIATIRFDRTGRSADSVVFYLHGELQVDSMFAGQSTVEFVQSQVLYQSDYSMVAQEVQFPWSAAAAETGLTVYYAGPVNPSKVRSPSNYMRIDSDGVYLRSYPYSLWFPVFLPESHDEYDVDFNTVILRTPAEFTPVFAGTRVSENVSEDERVSRWRAPGLPLFAAQCTVRRYETQTSEGCTVYYLPGEKTRAAASDILAFTNDLSALFRTYYRNTDEGGAIHVAELPRYGNISSGNMIGLTRDIWEEFSGTQWAQRVLGHELVHSYVQVPTPRVDSLWSLSIEGFPSYFHLPVMAELLGEKFYNSFMARIEEQYIQQRETGKSRRGWDLPREIPLLAIDAAQMSTYKDVFVLSDRALLFGHYLYRSLGKDRFFAFAQDLFNRDTLDAATFRDVIDHHLPGSRADIELWLSTTEFPQRLRITGSAGE